MNTTGTFDAKDETRVIPLTEEEQLEADKLEAAKVANENAMELKRVEEEEAAKEQADADAEEEAARVAEVDRLAEEARLTVEAAKKAEEAEELAAYNALNLE